MNTPDKAALKARKRELRAELERRKAEARAELARRRALVDLPQKKRRWPWVVLAILAALLLLLSDCTCAEPPVEEEPTGPPAEAPTPVETVETPTKRPIAPGRIGRIDRPEYEGEVPAPLPWILAFQRQVEARSPRLAACFVGAERPGRLKWTAAVAPETGRVSDHTLEPTVADETLTRAQKRCVIAVLSDPVYDLEAAGERATPSRVAMVIEF